MVIIDDLETNERKALDVQRVYLLHVTSSLFNEGKLKEESIVSDNGPFSDMMLSHVPGTSVSLVVGA